MVRKGYNPGSEHGVLNMADTFPVNLKERAATGRLMGERALSYLGVGIEYLGFTMEDDLHSVAIPELMSGLYDQNAGRRISNLAVNETEYLTIVRNAEAFTESVKAGTDRARQLDTITDRREAASERSVIHAVENKTQSFEGLMEWLQAENERLQYFRKEITKPHLSHMNDGELRQLGNSIWEFSFGNILRVVAHQKEWSEEQLVNAKRAMIEKMIHGKQQDRYWYWIELTDLAIQYNRNRRGLFNMKMRQAKSSAEKAQARANKTVQ